MKLKLSFINNALTNTATRGVGIHFVDHAEYIAANESVTDDKGKIDWSKVTVENNSISQAIFYQ